VSLDKVYKRYVSPEMLHIWSDENRYRTWRQLWYSIARAQQALGIVRISDEALGQMADAVNKPIDLGKVAAYEKELRHDVMAHIRAMEDDAPAAKGIVHLGCTSCDITDNAELIMMERSLAIVQTHLQNVVALFKPFLRTYAKLPCLGWTHYQPAQLTTVGKRAALWCHDFFLDYEFIRDLRNTLPFKGLRGATGTQTSYLSLFNNNYNHVKNLELSALADFSLNGTVRVCGQTYTRKIDTQVVSALAGVGESGCKMGNDIRLLMNLGEVLEPAEKSQVGSSAMAWKRNPMRSERMCSLGRDLIAMPVVMAHNSATQWLERSLDDSANRRLVLPQAFFLADGILRIVQNLVPGLEVNEAIIGRNLMRELPFMATEDLLMELTRDGGDRQVLHEIIRRHSRDTQESMRNGGENDLVQRLETEFGGPITLDPQKYTGCAQAQVEMFLEEMSYVTGDAERVELEV
jgi:adenylosuccinate lyase